MSGGGPLKNFAASPLLLYGGLALATVIALALIVKRGRSDGGEERSTGEAFGRGVAGFVGDVGVGVVKGVGLAFGVPDTHLGTCARALQEGRMWDASFDCPAADFLRGVFGVVPGGTGDADAGGGGAAPMLDRPGGAGATGTW